MICGLVGQTTSAGRSDIEVATMEAASVLSKQGPLSCSQGRTTVRGARCSVFRKSRGGGDRVAGSGSGVVDVFTNVVGGYKRMSQHLFDSSLQQLISANMGITNDFEHSFVLFKIGDEVQFGHCGGNHSVRVNMALDVII